MDKLTLDTNVLRDWAWCDGNTQEIRYRDDPSRRNHLCNIFTALRTFRDDGVCEFGVTTQVYTDYEKSVGELPPYIEEMIGSYVPISGPSIFSFPLIFPTVFVEQEDIDRLFCDVFPNSKPEHKKHKHNRKDAIQLYAHRIAERDYFITTDKTIIRAKPILAKKWHINVMTPEKYVLLKNG